MQLLKKVSNRINVSTHHINTHNSNKIQYRVHVEKTKKKI